MPRGQLLRIELVVEELFTNTVRHGYCTDSDAPVWLRIEPAPGSVALIYQDAAPAYNPLTHDIELTAPLAARAIGGLGVHLIRELATDVTYRRADSRNILTLTFVTPDTLRSQSPRT